MEYGDLLKRSRILVWWSSLFELDLHFTSLIESEQETETLRFCLDTGGSRVFIVLSRQVITIAAMIKMPAIKKVSRALSSNSSWGPYLLKLNESEKADWIQDSSNP